MFVFKQGAIFNDTMPNTIFQSSLLGNVLLTVHDVNLTLHRSAYANTLQSVDTIALRSILLSSIVLNLEDTSDFAV